MQYTAYINNISILLYTNEKKKKHDVSSMQIITMSYSLFGRGGHDKCCESAARFTRIARY